MSVPVEPRGHGMDAARKAVQGPALGVICGSLLVFSGTLMTWVTASGGFVVYDRSGVSYTRDALVLILLAGIAALGAVGELLELEVLPDFVRGWVWVDAGIMIALAVYDLNEIKDKVRTANYTPGVSAEVGPGVYVCIAGAVLVLLSGLRMVQARKDLEPEPDREKVDA